MAAVVELRGVGRSYRRGSGETVAVEDVSLAVGPGEVAAVIGASGAGKSTLARMVSLLESPSTGQVLIDDVDTSTMSERQRRRVRRRIGTIFQSSSLLAQRTAADNVALPMKFAGTSRRDRRRRAADLLDRVGIADKAEAYPSQLSGGQRQRVGIARALALEPSLLVCDEATSGLDPSTTAAILALIDDLRRELDLAVIVITHEMEVVRDIADGVTLLENGRVVEQSSTIAAVRNWGGAVSGALLPEPRALVAPPGDVVWDLRYAGTQTPSTWLAELAQEVDGRLRVLAANVSVLGGEPYGRALVAVPPGVTDVAAFVDRWQIAARVVDGDEREQIEASVGVGGS